MSILRNYTVGHIAQHASKVINCTGSFVYLQHLSAGAQIKIKAYSTSQGGSLVMDTIMSEGDKIETGSLFKRLEISPHAGDLNECEIIAGSGEITSGTLAGAVSILGEPTVHVADGDIGVTRMPSIHIADNQKVHIQSAPASYFAAAQPVKFEEEQEVKFKSTPNVNVVNKATVTLDSVTEASPTNVSPPSSLIENYIGVAIDTSETDITFNTLPTYITVSTSEKTKSYGVYRGNTGGGKAMGFVHPGTHGQRIYIGNRTNDKKIIIQTLDGSHLTGIIIAVAAVTENHTFK